MRRKLFIVMILFTAGHLPQAHACCSGYVIPPPYAKPFRPQAFDSLPKVADVPFERLRQLPHLEHYSADHEPYTGSVTYYAFDNICLSEGPSEAENEGNHQPSAIAHYPTTKHFLASAKRELVAKHLYCYAAWWLQHRWPDAEPYIKGTQYAKPYVENVLHASWPAGRDLLATTPKEHALNQGVLSAKDELALLEKDDNEAKQRYTIRIRGEWPAYERQILDSLQHGNHKLRWYRDYWRMVKRRPWPALEKQIIANLQTAKPSQLYGFYAEMEIISFYMRDVRRGKWPELQAWIAQLEHSDPHRQQEQYYYDLGAQQP